MELLRSQGAARACLFERADELRRQFMGDEVFVRGIVEFSNLCANDCQYCGIRASNRALPRYTMSEDEIVAAAHALEQRRHTTIVLQSGEAAAFSDEAVGRLIKRVKSETELAVTLSLGNRPAAVYRYWRDCGMDRYLLRFETSDAELFSRLHPAHTLEERLACLRALRDCGAQVGSGFMIGLPGETLEVLAANLLLCRDLNLDMIGIGPFIPHPATPLGGERNAYADDPEMFFVALAVLRLLNPDAHIPATTAFDAAFPGQGRNLALCRGANVFMPNSTPRQYRYDYQLYPGKPSVDETPDASAAAVLQRLRALGRSIGRGPGHLIRATRHKST